MPPPEDDDFESFRQAWQRIQQQLPAVVGVEFGEVQRAVVRLLQADILQQATVGRSDRGGIERFVWMMTLNACIELINSTPDLETAQLAAPLGRMLMALEDLDGGRVHPALRPRKRGRKDTGPRSRRDLTLRGHLAGIVEGLMRRGGMSEPEAAHWIQRRLSARGVQLTADQLVEWRKRARGAKPDNFQRLASRSLIGLILSPQPTG